MDGGPASRLRDRALSNRRHHPRDFGSHRRAGEGDLPVKATVRVEEWPDLRLRYGLQLVTGGNLASEEGRQELAGGSRGRGLPTDAVRPRRVDRCERPAASAGTGSAGLPEPAAHLRHSGSVEPLPDRDTRAHEQRRPRNAARRPQDRAHLGGADAGETPAGLRRCLQAPVEPVRFRGGGARSGRERPISTSSSLVSWEPLSSTPETTSSTPRAAPSAPPASSGAATRSDRTIR